MNADEIVRALRNMLPEPVDYAELVGSPVPSSYGHHFVYEDPEPYIVEEATDLIESLQAQLSESQRREQAAVEDMTAVLKRDSDDICAYCKNRVECESQQCEKYSSGVGDVDGNYPDWKWTCEDFAYGTCRMMENTPCNGCFENDCSGFEWRAQPANEPLTLEQSTNADRIRGMSDEEMAVWLVGATVCERVCGEDEYCHGNECVKRVTRWLKQPAKEEHNETDRC